MSHLIKFEEATTDKQKALAAIEVSRFKSANARKWEWANIAAGYAFWLGIDSPLDFLGDGRQPNLEPLEEAVMKAPETNTLTDLANPI